MNAPCDSDYGVTVIFHTHAIIKGTEHRTLLLLHFLKFHCIHCIHCIKVSIDAACRGHSEIQKISFHCFDTVTFYDSEYSEVTVYALGAVADFLQLRGKPESHATMASDGLSHCWGRS